MRARRAPIQSALRGGQAGTALVVLRGIVGVECHLLDPHLARSIAADRLPVLVGCSHDSLCAGQFPRARAASDAPRLRGSASCAAIARRLEDHHELQRLCLLLLVPRRDLLGPRIEGHVVDALEVEDEHVIDRAQRAVAVELDLLILRAVQTERESLRGDFHAVPMLRRLVAPGLRRLPGRGQLCRVQIRLRGLRAQRLAQLLELRLLRELHDVLAGGCGEQQDREERHGSRIVQSRK